MDIIVSGIRLRIFSLLCTLMLCQSLMGENAHAADQNTFPKRFVMFSAYGLAPYSRAYRHTALAQLSRNDISGIVYSTLGYTTKQLKKRGHAKDEHAINRQIFSEAKKHGAHIVLQMRLFQNQIASGTSGQKVNFPAQDLLRSEKLMNRLLDQVELSVSLYTKYFGDSCSIIVFEEAGIYHSPQGGGLFWSSSKKTLSPTPQLDKLFAKRLVRLFSKIRARIKSIEPTCLVGMHLGHSVLINEEPLAREARWLQKNQANPDFLFYDFYLKAQKNFGRYERKLRRRKPLLSRIFGVPVMHLMQMHTMNNFQHGAGRTLSRTEIDSTFALSRQLGFDGLGFYTKNALRTSNFQNEPFDANDFGQRTLLESSINRWNYGLQKLVEQSSTDWSEYVDILVEGDFQRGSVEALVWNTKTGAWMSLGYIDATRPNRTKKSVGLYTLRLIKKSEITDNQRSVKMRLSRRNQKTPTLRRIAILPAAAPAQFKTSAQLKEKAISGALSSTALGMLETEKTLIENNLVLEIPVIAASDTAGN